MTLLHSCTVCGIEYESKDKKSKYCSFKCLSSAYRERMKGKNNPNWKGGITFGNCILCGKEFRHNGAGKYCSGECRGKSQQRRILKNCENCGNEFEMNKAYEKRVTCCSKKCKYALWSKKALKQIKCRGCDVVMERPKNAPLFHSASCLLEWRKKRYGGENNPRWIGGSILYRGADWEVQRMAAAKRDNFTCQICFSIPEKLHVHHIIPYRLSKDNKIDNLITVCPSCHGREDNDFRRFGKPSLRIRRWKEALEGILA